MLSVNKAIIVGEVSDPPKHSNGDGWSVSRFTVKTVKTFIKKDGTEGISSTWIRCNAWNALADKMHAGVPMGTIVAVTGEIENRKYMAKDGTEKRDFSIKADSIEVMSYSNSQDSTLKDQPKIDPAPTEKYDDKLLF